MKNNHRFSKSNTSSLKLFLPILMTLLIVSGCGNNSTSDEPSSHDKANMKFHLIFEDLSNQNAKSESFSKSAEPNICDDYGIETVRIDVYQLSNDKLEGFTEVNCAGNSSATVSNLTTGLNLYVVCRCLAGSKVLWSGQADNIFLSPGES